MKEINRSRKRLALARARARIDRQVKSGSLTVRQMTPEERERYGPPKNLKVPKLSYRHSLAVADHYHEDDVRDDA